MTVKFLFKRSDAALHGPGIQPERKHPATQFHAAARVLRTGRQHRPVNAVLPCRLGDPLDGLPKLREKQNKVRSPERVKKSKP